MTAVHDTRECADHAKAEPDLVRHGHTIGGPGKIVVEVNCKQPLTNRFLADLDLCRREVDHYTGIDLYTRCFQVRDTFKLRPPIEINLGQHSEQDTQIAMEIAAVVATYMNARHRTQHARQGDEQTELTVVIDWRDAVTG